MFFLYVLKESGYPITQIFEEKIRDIPTERFSKNFDDDYGHLSACLANERKMN